MTPGVYRILPTGKGQTTAITDHFCPLSTIASHINCRFLQFQLLNSSFLGNLLKSQPFLAEPLVSNQERGLDAFPRQCKWPLLLKSQVKLSRCSFNLAVQLINSSLNASNCICLGINKVSSIPKPLKIQPSSHDSFTALPKPSHYHFFHHCHLHPIINQTYVVVVMITAIIDCDRLCCQHHNHFQYRSTLLFNLL